MAATINGPRMTPPFLGKGLMMPLTEDPHTGDFMRVKDEDNVDQCVRDGIFTALGERVMLAPFGTVAPKMLFEDSDIVASVLEPSVRDHLERYEPRIIVSSVSVRMDSRTDNTSSFICTIVYIIRATNKRQNLTFPFYLTEDNNV